MSWFDPWDAIEAVALNDDPVERAIARATPPIRSVLESALACREASVADCETLLAAEGDDLVALVRTADVIRAQDVGDEVTYVVNRNINFTNVCFVNCQFCAFKRQRWESDAYTHGLDVVLGKVDEAIARGATEVCMQGGINPDMEPFTYRDVLVAIKTRHPGLHVHAFSPMEILYGARRTSMPYVEYLSMLRDAGLGSIPGTAAEILDDDVREILSHKKVDTRTWIEIITTAHRVGVPTTSTVMYGHIETPGHIARHIDLIRSLQKETGGFTEFVPLGFVHQNTVLFQEGMARPGPTLAEHLKIHALARVMLAGAIDNVQVSWVKLSRETAQLCLRAGANDYGGTLMEENISRLAGATSGEYLSPEQFHQRIRELGRTPAERNTTYTKIKLVDDRNSGEMKPGGAGLQPCCDRAV